MDYNAEASSSKGGKSTLPQHHHWHGVLDNALDAVGSTPLIRLQRIAREEGFKCNLMGKCEYLSAGGSVKDRIAKRMIEDAERKGLLIPGKSVVIEPTSGNTGIGLAMACAIKGYKCIITLPAKMSREKEVMMRALGAVIVRTPTEAAWDSPESHIGIARKLRDTIPHAIILDQYSNPHNPLAHYYGTYPEIRSSLAGSTFDNKNVSALFAGAGTGGTITGLARGIRDDESEAGPSRKRAKIVAIDPEGSILGGGDVVGSYEVEGIGYDFFPEVLDPKPPLIDDWVKTNDEMAFAACKRLIMSEGLFVGGSSGSALSGAIKYLHSEAGRALAQDADANVVVIFPDGVRNYISKPWFLDVAESEATAELKVEVRDVVGRPLDQPGAQAVLKDAEVKGVELEKGEGVDGRATLESSESAEKEVLPNGSAKGTDGVNGHADKGMIEGVLAKLGLKAE